MGPRNRPGGETSPGLNAVFSNPHFAPMKTLTHITLLAVGLTAAALSGLNAADTTAAPTAKHPRLQALLAHRQAIRQRIAQRLGLSTDQISQLKAERAKTVAAVKAIRADKNLTQEQKKTQVRDALKMARTEMRGVLTSDQQAKLRQMRARLHLRG
jgi:hypothetical protein